MKLIKLYIWKIALFDVLFQRHLRQFSGRNLYFACAPYKHLPRITRKEIHSQEKAIARGTACLAQQDLRVMVDYYPDMRLQQFIVKANIILGHFTWRKLCYSQNYSNFPIILSVCQSCNLALGLLLYFSSSELDKWQRDHRKEEVWWFKHKANLLIMCRLL